MHVFDYLDLYVFPTGRRAFAQRQIAQRAGARGLTTIASHAEAAVAHEEQTLQLELQRKSAGTSAARFSPETLKLDNVLDKKITGLDGFLDSQERLYGEDSEPGQAAATIRRAILADGAAAITQLSFEQQSEAVDAMLTRLDQEDLADSLALVAGLTAHIEQVRDCHAAYRDALSKDVARGPNREQLRTMQTQGQELLAQSVVLVLAHHIASQDLEITRELLAPIDRQSEAIRNARRRRRRPTDVDPTTGEDVELPEPTLTDGPGNA
ncbi:MAG: hypothetical protein AAGF11_34665 [Myxococcota bacterium]